MFPSFCACCFALNTLIEVGSWFLKFICLFVCLPYPVSRSVSECLYDGEHNKFLTGSYGLKTRVCEPHGAVKELPVDWFIIFLGMSDTLAITGLMVG